MGAAQDKPQQCPAGSGSMLATHAPLLQAMSVVLASGSPRRRELLAVVLGPEVPFLVVPSGFAEDLPKGDDPEVYCMRTATAKGREVWSRCEAAASGAGGACAARSARQLVISADTIVVSPAGKVLEKPANAEEATQMLTELSGASHKVYTGVALFGNEKELSFCECTTVTFSKLTPAAIAAYVSSGDPFDKAGGYGIQGAAGAFVEKIDGCFFNVVGLPVNRLCRMLDTFLQSSMPGE
mmetsp:Transcript_136188/g.240708  ORF Transcript_136188/g.240708 Transcript_136188/m.240708 type:complete len:239 (-) Transcript_136188:83-799(-)